MSKYINGAIAVVCLTFLLQIGVSAQGATQTKPQDSPIKSSDTSSSSIIQGLSPDKSGQLAIFAETPASKAKGDVKTEISKEINIAEPKIGPKIELKNPSIDPKVSVRESKLSESFAAPEPWDLGEPRTFKATAYALYGKTRTGAYVRRGVIAADPRILPLHSVVQIKAGKYTGVYTVHDTGRLIKGNIVDVWVPSTREARQFGRQRIKLHVLRFGKSKP